MIDIAFIWSNYNRICSVCGSILLLELEMNRSIGILIWSVGKLFQSVLVLSELSKATKNVKSHKQQCNHFHVDTGGMIPMTHSLAWIKRKKSFLKKIVPYKGKKQNIRKKHGWLWNARESGNCFTSFCFCGVLWMASYLRYSNIFCNFNGNFVKLKRHCDSSRCSFEILWMRYQTEVLTHVKRYYQRNENSIDNHLVKVETSEIFYFD